ncbi:MAG TPA: carbon monoxide dehydrogenase subunit G [Terriglobia bacterium]|nr:carbon monoxide dehydrogenase subunit G [Terriglobia bacterium]
MRVEGAYIIPADRDVVWQSLLDPEVLSRSLPGDGKLKPNSDGSFHAELKVGIAAVKGTYHGHIQILDAVAPEHYRMKVEGQGTGGFVRGEGTLTLSQNGAGGTVIAYAGDAQVGGVIANVGQRLMQGAAKQIVGKFFLEFSKQLQRLGSERAAEGTVATVSSPLLAAAPSPASISVSAAPATDPEPAVASPPEEPTGGLHAGDHPSQASQASQASEPSEQALPTLLDQRAELREPEHRQDDRAPTGPTDELPDGAQNQSGR